nr:hypothetical protein [Tanacetum cinerariifolium]
MQHLPEILKIDNTFLVVSSLNVVHIIVKDTRTMDMKIDQQVALDEALVPHASKLRIGKINFRFRSDITSKESTLQLVYDVLRLTPFYKAFLVTAYVPKIYMQEFWATTTKNVDFAYLLWEDFVYQVEHKDAKKSNEMYYPRFTKVIIHYFRTKDPLIPRRNKVNWHYVRDDQMFTTIKLVSRHQNTMSGAAPPKTKASVRKTKSSSNTTITPPTAARTRLSTSAKGKQPAKSSKAKGLTVLSESSDEDDNNEVDEGSDDQDDDQNDDDQDDNDQDEGNDDDQDTDKDGDDFIHPKLSIHEEKAKYEESFDPIVQTPEKSDDEVAPLTLTAPTLPPPTIPTISQVPQAPSPPTTAPSTFLQDLLNFGSMIIERYMDQRMNEAIKVVVQIQSDRLRDEAQAKNEEFLNNLDENIQKIIKEQVKEQVKVQVFKILPKIEKTVNEQLKAEVLTRSSNSSKTSYAVAADISEMELKKILIEKMESNKDTVTLKRHRDDANKDEEPSVGSDQGSKRRREGKEPESTSAPKEKATKTTGAADDQPIAEASQHPEWFQQQKKPPTPNRRRVIPFEHFINNDLEYLRGGASSRKYTTFITKTKAADYGHIKWIEDLFYGFAVNKESARDVYLKRRIIIITELQIVECHDYKHLDWITMRRDDDKLYKFKEGDFKRLRIQDIEDMLLLLVQGKMTNLTVEECFAFNVSLRMFRRSIVIQRHVEDLQLGVESYQKNINLINPDTYHSDLKRKEAYTTYSNPRGFIY